MSHFLARDSDSDTDSTTSSGDESAQHQQSTSQQQGKTATLNDTGREMSSADLNLPPGVYKWMKRSSGGAGGGGGGDDEDEDEEAEGAASRTERVAKQLENICEKLELAMDAADFTHNYVNVIENLNEADVIAVKLINTFQVLPRTYFQFLQFTQDTLSDHVEAAKQAVEEADDPESSDLKDENELLASKSLKRLRLLVADKLKQHDATIARAGKAIEEEGGEEGQQDAAGDKKITSMQDLSEVGMLKTFLEYGIDPRNHVPKFERIVTASQQQNLPYITATALGVLCNATLIQEGHQLFLPRSAWRRALDYYQKAIKLTEESDLQISEKWDIVIPPPGGEVTNRRRATINSGFHYLALRLKESLYAWMQWNSSTHSEFQSRLIDEQSCLVMLDSTLRYYTDLQHKKGQAKVAQVMLEVVGPRSPAAHTLFMKGQPAMPEAPKPKGWFIVSEDVGATVNALYDVVISKDDTQKATAILLVITNYCLREEFAAAREMFLLFGVLDVEKRRGRGAKTAIAHARCVAHLGLCAFRNGFFSEAKLILDDLCSRASRALRNSGEIKELLGQKENFKNLRDEELEEVFQRTLVQPPHHHISVLLLESAYMVVTILDEALAEARTNHRVRDRLFVDILRRFDHRALAGEPADDAEAIYATYKALLNGDIASAIKYVEGLSAWSRLPNKKVTIGEKLLHRVKNDGLRAFLIAHGNHFKSLTVDHLAHKFMLSPNEIRNVVAHLVLHENSAILGSFDRDSERLIIDRGAQPRTHELAKEISHGLARDFHDASIAAAARGMTRRSHSGHGGGRGGYGGRGGHGGRGGRGGQHNRRNNQQGGGGNRQQNSARPQSAPSM